MKSLDKIIKTTFQIGEMDFLMIFKIKKLKTKLLRKDWVTKKSSKIWYM